MHGDEIELKLAIAHEGLERLRRHPLVRAHTQGRPATRQLTSIYYDTADLALARAGVTVRVRVVGRRNIQTVKARGRRSAGLFERREWEAPVASKTVDVPMLRATGVAVLTDGDVADRLAPVFRTEIRRTARILAGEGWRLELALDRGAVRSGDLSEDICEMELELLEGGPGHLFAVARAIVATVPARLITLSKSDRGYGLAFGRPPAPVKARPVAVGRDTTVALGFQSIARNCLEHLLANEAPLLARDGEAVHQMRVALRRLRSAVKVFRPVVDGPQLAELTGQTRWLMDYLGPARDSDVFLAEIVDPVAARHPGNPALAALRARWRDHRDDALDAAVAAVADRRFTEVLLAAGAWIEAGDWLTGDREALDAPLPPFAARVLSKRHRRLLKAGGRRLAELSPADLHRARILGKQLRYAGEFFAPLHPGKATREFLAALAGLQDLLGALNDIAVAEPRLVAGQLDGDLAWAAGVVSGWHDARRPALLAEAEGAWKKFRKLKPFWS
ncbi:MAG: CHAD domain-containing protein [Pseudomonadota bacterium]